MVQVTTFEITSELKKLLNAHSESKLRITLV
jgi:hypothetical protein